MVWTKCVFCIVLIEQYNQSSINAIFCSFFSQVVQKHTLGEVGN